MITTYIIMFNYQGRHFLSNFITCLNINYRCTTYMFYNKYICFTFIFDWITRLLDHVSKENATFGCNHNIMYFTSSVTII